MAAVAVMLQEFSTGARERVLFLNNVTLTRERQVSAVMTILNLTSAGLITQSTKWLTSALLRMRSALRRRF
jgi:hypothetical protein